MWWSTRDAWGTINCNDYTNDHRSFKMMTISSNGFDFNVTNSNICCICLSKTGLQFELSDDLDGCYHKCKYPWVPRSENDYKSILENSEYYTDTNHDTFPGFWTDYERVNETHFWSEIAETWWSQCRSSGLGNPDYAKFMSSVMIDSKGKLRNMNDRIHSGCICVGKVNSYFVRSDFYRIEALS